MTDFTEENGATRVIPGSNHFEDKLRFEEKDTIPAEMSKGSVLIYNGSVYHAGGANRSEATRIGINITYNLSWLRQEENQYLSVPLEVARTLPVDLLKLIGYRRGAYSLGYVDDLRDPLDVIKPRESKECSSGLGDLEFDAGAAAKRAGAIESAKRRAVRGAATAAPQSANVSEVPTLAWRRGQEPAPAAIVSVGDALLPWVFLASSVTRTGVCHSRRRGREFAHMVSLADTRLHCWIFLFVELAGFTWRE